MDWDQVLGLAAGCLTSFSLFPQLIKTYKTKDATDISLLMFSILAAGLLLWVIYGIRKSDVPIIATNSLAFVLNVIMICFKFQYNKK